MPRTNAQITIAVVPRDRFSYAAAALDGIWRSTPDTVPLVYVDGGSPSYMRSHVERQARARRFRLIRTDHYLTPNEARNLALRGVDTPYVVFIDNDVVVSPGWLDGLLECARETAADVVAPLCFVGDPETDCIHTAGGDAHVEERTGGRYFVEHHRYCNMRLGEVPAPLRREPCELIEFHCTLVRREVFDRLGPLDEAFLSAMEHLDFALQVRAQGGAIWFEPAARVTYVRSAGRRLSDLPYFQLRWSEAWNTASLAHFQDKWRLAADDPFLAFQRSWLRRYRRRPLGRITKSLRAMLGARAGARAEDILDRLFERALTRRSIRVRARAGAVVAGHVGAGPAVRCQADTAAGGSH